MQQPPPSLGNQYDDDRVLRSYLARVIPKSMLDEIEPSLKELGRLAGGELYQMQLADRLNEPTLTQWDAWGKRIDYVEVTPVWREAERIAVEYGLVATAYEQKHGSLSRVHQCALAYLFTPSTDIYSCPLAMTDGAARTLLNSGNQALIDHVVPHLISRNPSDFWTAGQWMTEITGGSDVGLSETSAREVQRPTSNVQSHDLGFANQVRMSQGQEGGLGPALWTDPMSNVQSSADSQLPTPDSRLSWRLYGNKWFASAITSHIALTLARPEGNPPGGRGLALFYIELRDEHGRLGNIQINRLKDKLGTRKVPTAELTLSGTPAQLVKGPNDGVRNITPLLNITRLWNGISAVSLMRRGLALALDYARKRVAFGSPLIDKPLHMDTLAGLQAEAEAAFHLAFYVAELTGLGETRSPMSNVQCRKSESATGAVARPSGRALDYEASAADVSDSNSLLLRLLTPVMKLTTAKQAVTVLSEVIEAFGGAGYVEDTGLPQLLRDAQVLPIWEGTTNVLSLDTLRALGSPTSNRESPTSNVQRQSAVSSQHPAIEIATQDRLAQGQEGGHAPALNTSPMSNVQRQNHQAAISVQHLPIETSLPLQAFKSAVTHCLSEAHDPNLTDPIRTTQSALAHAETWLTQTNKESLESGARRFALTLGRTMELALLIKHAQWSNDHESDARSIAAARRFAKSGIDLLIDLDPTLGDAHALLGIT